MYAYISLFYFEIASIKSTKEGDKKPTKEEKSQTFPYVIIFMVYSQIFNFFIVANNHEVRGIHRDTELMNQRFIFQIMTKTKSVNN